MNNKFLLIGTILLIFSLFHIVNAYSQNILENKEKIIKDFIQIYHGYEKRPEWHSNQVKHYVFRNNEGKPEWLFDGFLFLEIYARFDDKNYDYGAAQPGKYASDKAVWEHLVCKNFEDTRGPDALELVLDSLAQEKHYPPSKRKVIFSIPNPIYGTKNWGFIGDKALDFNKPEDRFLAIEWYVKRIMEEWKKKKYKHLDFGGFYWIHEQIDFSHQDDVMLKKVNSLLKEKDVYSYWLPHLTAKGVDKWAELGFTYAYKQPNYFFYADKHPNAIINTIKNTQELGLGIMMEFDGRVIDDTIHQKLFYDYIYTFQKEGVWDKQAVNYYDGGNGWLRLSTEKSPAAKKMYNILSNIIVKRQGSSQIKDMDMPQVDISTFPKNKNGYITIFDGKTFNGWRGYGSPIVPDKWMIENKTLKFNSKGTGTGGDILFSHKFKNFELEVEWKISKGGNSGIFYLAREIENYVVAATAPEFQILDNKNYQYDDANRLSASLYSFIPAEPQNAKPAEKWNKARIKVIDGKVTHFQNGRAVVQYTLWTLDWIRMLENSGFGPQWNSAFQVLADCGGPERKGYIVFQDHGDDVWFRNIRVKELNSK